MLVVVVFPREALVAVFAAKEGFAMRSEVDLKFTLPCEALIAGVGAEIRIFSRSSDICPPDWPGGSFTGILAL